jgi:hypothetical protein
MHPAWICSGWKRFPSAKKADRAIPSREKLYNATMAGDLLSNSLYYTLAGMGRKKSVLYRGAG